MGHEVKLIAPQFVKPYLKSQKNDTNDAEAICEAVGRPNMRFVTAKPVAQQDMLAAHRIRTELVRQRTAKANQIRGLLAEYGVIVPVGINALRRVLPDIQEDAENGLSGLFRRLLEGLRADWVELELRVDQLDGEIEAAAKEDETARRLQTVPGIGPITATALAASVGDGRQFRRGRDRAAWLGLTPGQHSSGGKERLLGMSKRGDSYLRTLLIHGARGHPGRGQQGRPAQPLDYRSGGAAAQERGRRGLRGREAYKPPPRGCPPWPGGIALQQRVGYTRAVAPWRRMRDSLLVSPGRRVDPDCRGKNRWLDPPLCRVRRVIHRRPGRIRLEKIDPLFLVYWEESI